ncbi:MAG: methylenetetrahydrofolate reductase [Rhodobacteraceae bacterium]|nr:methylenetetrahydrofolate reductase [Paracoccaceae bacterium]
MAIFQFKPRKSAAEANSGAVLSGFLDEFSIEVMPRTAAQVADFLAILPKGTRVYVAHIDGTPIADMVATARRLAEDGFEVMPHFPARVIPDRATLADWIDRYQGEAGIRTGLILGGGLGAPRGAFDESMQLLDTGLFERAGFTRLHVAGHPEGNRDIDPDGSERRVMDALRRKQAFRDRTGIDMAIATQFCFEAAPVIAWAERLAAEGIDLPIHVGAAGPAKLQTLIKFSIACGVGASLRVLQRRARDVTKLVMPFEPTQFLTDLAQHCEANPQSLIAGAHLFPLGGIATTAEWARTNRGAPGLRTAIA